MNLFGTIFTPLRFTRASKPCPAGRQSGTGHSLSSDGTLQWITPAERHDLHKEFDHEIEALLRRPRRRRLTSGLHPRLHTARPTGPDGRPRVRRVMPMGGL